MTTPYTFATVFLPALFSCYVMAVLVQLPHTRLYRAALLPVVYWTSFRASISLDFSYNRPGFSHLNQGLVLGMVTVAMRSTVWALAQKIYTRIPISKSSHRTLPGHDGNTPVEHCVSLSAAMWNAWDLIINLRGIGWNRPQKMQIPAPYFYVESRTIFFVFSVSRAVTLAFVADVLGKYVHSFGPDTFATPKGGTIFDSSLTPLERYTRSSVITMASGFAAYFLIDAIYQIHAALYIVLFQQHPSQWPPLFDSPWLSTSLTSFWGQRWHQLFRESFVVLGSTPMKRYFGRVGTVLGAFALSGVLHDIGMRGMDRGADTLPMVGFFLLHGFGVILEYAWKQATGRRVGGVFGFLWVWIAFISSGQIIVETWARRGVLASEFHSKGYSPAELFLDLIS